MRLIHDAERCEGHGLCTEAAPELLHLDDSDELVLDYQTIGDGQLAQAREAARVCPVAALRVG